MDLLRFIMPIGEAEDVTLLDKKWKLAVLGIAGVIIITAIIVGALAGN